MRAVLTTKTVMALPSSLYFMDFNKKWVPEESVNRVMEEYTSGRLYLRGKL
jgi:hypothetical protein